MLTRLKELRRHWSGLSDPQAGTIALFALVISLANSVYQVWQWVEGPDLRLLSPELAVIIPHHNINGQTYVRFALRASYINGGPRPSAAIVVKEKLVFELEDSSFEQHWQSFETFEGEGCDTHSVDSLDVEPVAVPGQDARSHVTYFAPRSDPASDAPFRNFVELDAFLGEQTEREVSLDLQAELDSGYVESVRCTFTLMPHHLDLLRAKCPVTVGCQSTDS